MFSKVKRKLTAGKIPAQGGSPKGGAADEVVPLRIPRRRSSIVRQDTIVKLDELPKLREVPVQQRPDVFINKLKLCEVQFQFFAENMPERDPATNKKGKELKRQTLLELVDYVNNQQNQKIFTQTGSATTEGKLVMEHVTKMISANIFRSMPPQSEDFDPEEDEPSLEPTWSHLQVVYEFFLRFIVSQEVTAKQAKKYVDQTFVRHLLSIMESEDPRERDYLKTILHRIYGKFMHLRSYIRQSIRHIFYTFVYETERHNGIGELLEILGSIINGFAMPLKQEHVKFLEMALLPLHKPKCVSLYHQQLSYCVTQFVEKDPNTGMLVVRIIFRLWPWSCSGKQVLLMNELEEIMEYLPVDFLDGPEGPTLLELLRRCVGSVHFQVAERALFLWNNEHLLVNGCLKMAHYAERILEAVYPALQPALQGQHWNKTVDELANNVLALFRQHDEGVVSK